MAAFSLSNWVQATAIRVIYKDGKPKTTPFIIIVVMPYKNANNYNADIWYFQVRKKCITWDNICGSLCWTSISITTVFRLWKVISQRFEYVVVFYNWIEFGKTWTWNWLALGNISFTLSISLVSLIVTIKPSN
jgi:hypothetical protein